MPKSVEPVIIKRYAGQRLYNPGMARYVMPEDLKAMARRGEDFVVLDAETGEDVTTSPLPVVEH